MKLKFFFAWYDLWIGAYWDRKQRTLYICPLPMCVVSFQFSPSQRCENCGRRPGLNEPTAAWGHLRHHTEKHLGYANGVGVFCDRCGIANSDAGK